MKISLKRICSIFRETVDSIDLNRMTLQKAQSSLNRLNERYTPILEIINILYESLGIQLEEGTASVNLRGYFFDMNSFFETLVGRLLSNCKESFSVKDQFSLHDMFIYTPGYNPRGRKSPTPRPDFALMKKGKVVKLVDAKYRDLWDRNLPSDMLYQLAVYAVSGIGDKTSTILYLSTSDIPSIQKIDINDPVSDLTMGNVIMQPINLLKVSELISNDMKNLERYICGIIDDA